MISIFVGIVLGLIWSAFRYRKVCKYRIKHSATENAGDSRFRVIGKTNDGRDIGLKGGVVYIRDKDGLSWTEAKYDEEMVSK